LEIRTRKVSQLRPARYLLLLLPLAACAHKTPAPPTPFVNTTIVRLGSVQPSRRLAGIIAPYQNVAVQSTLSEAADSVAVQEGDVVHKGEVLAVLDTADLEAQLRADEATANSNAATTSHAVSQGSLSIAQGADAMRAAAAVVNQAKANQERDQSQLTRDQNLYAKGYVSLAQVEQDQATHRDDQAALDNANSQLSSARSNVQANGTLGSGGLQQSTVQQAQAQVAVAQAQAEQVQVQIAKATIVSPIDGVVVNRNFNPGEYPGTRQLFTLQQVDPVYAVLHGSGAEVANIQPGVRVQVLAADLGNGATFTGTVVGVLNQINPGSTDFQVKALIPNPFRKLRPGMAVVGTVPLPAIRGIVIPETAFTDDNHNAIMSVQSDGTLKTTAVTEIGADSTNSIVRGIVAGARILQDGQQSVGDGQKVQFH
jgi:multidrug efflux pump subunit AcrA (membrane-fusion protein)